MGKMMGKYCKAYPVASLREFPGWSEKTENLRKERKVVEGKEVEVERLLSDQDFLYLQENYVVTDGIFMDDHVIFDDVTPEWIDFCQNTLKFEVPAYEAVQVQEAEPENARGNGQS